MLEELSVRLGKIATQKRLKEKLEQDFYAVEAELQDKASQLAALKAQLDQEQVDVEKLERVSLAYLFQRYWAAVNSSWRKNARSCSRRSFATSQLSTWWSTWSSKRSAC